MEQYNNHGDCYFFNKLKKNCLVTRSVLQNAASVTALFLTTEAVY
ncbi:MAG: hypothetical protein ABS938_01550 [Psychrobacillus psychrodurans]